MVKKKKTKDAFQAFLVDGANFTEHEEYPVIESWMISKEYPVKIIPFNKHKKEKDLSSCYLCFYAPDETFERVRRNPKRYIGLFSRCKGIIGFDFSIHTDMPIIKQKSQINDNLSLTYFYGKNGVKVIPNIRYGIEDTSDEFLAAIPHNTLIAIGTHGFIQMKSQKYNWLRFLEKIVNTLEPTGIIAYGYLSSSIFDSIKKKVPVYCYEPWIRERRRKEKENVDKRP